jgi:putative phosphoribosyl transferase
MYKNLKRESCIFKNREDACNRVIDILQKEILKSKETVVLGVSEGGVYFANRVATALQCRMDILITEPIYSQVNPKLPIAMIGETEKIVMHQALIDAFDISKDYIYSQSEQKYREEISSHIDRYRDGLALDGLNNKFVLLVDDCAQTGLTMMTSIKTAISLGAKNIFVAVPIIDNVVYKNLVKVCDDLFCPSKIDDYISVDYYYESLEVFSFEEIYQVIYENKKSKGKIENE